MKDCNVGSVKMAFLVGTMAPSNFYTSSGRNKRVIPDGASKSSR